VDALLMLPQLAAIYCALVRRPLVCGVCCAIGLLTNVKAVSVVATCALWFLSDLPMLAAGLLVPLAVAAIAGASLGGLRDFYEQVWQWGLVYAGTKSSVGMAVRRCADWLGFHAALLAGIVLALREVRYRFGVWLLLSCVPLFMGNHFAPRYFFQVLPVMVILASRGIVVGLERFGRPGAALLAVLLLMPMVRFGPRYAELIWDNVEHRQTTWSDAALDIDSQQVAHIINARKQAGDTLFVWGYRPDVYVYTRLVPPGKFSDSQPLDGVPADRHLESSEASVGIPAGRNRSQLIQTEPTFVVDGLGLLNPALKVEGFGDMSVWMRRYRLIAETKLSRIYARE
jgi:hypothetical protein